MQNPNQFGMWQYPYQPTNNYIQHQNVFETRKVASEEEARQYINTVTAQPLLLFENDREIFYMIQNGSLQKFSYQRIDEQSQLQNLEKQVAALTDSVNLILGYIDQGGANNGEHISNVATKSTK